MPRRSNDVYQVDLIAALFGGFMIAWLTSAQEVDYQLETTEIGFATLNVKLVGKSNKYGGRNVWLGVLPTGLKISDYNCLSESLDSEIDSAIFASTAKRCQEKSIDRLGGDNTNDIVEVMNYLEEDCFEDAKDNPLVKYKSYNRSHVMDISIIGINQETIYAGLLKDNSNLISPRARGLNDRWTSGRAGHTRCRIPTAKGQFISVIMIPNRDEVQEFNLSLNLGAGKPKNFYTLITSSGEAKGYLSKGYTARNGSKYVVDPGVVDDLENIKLIAELCIHSGGSADCFIGSGVYAPNTSIPLTKKN